MKRLNPEPTRLSRKKNFNFNSNEASVPEPEDKHIVRISRERELPSSLAQAHQSRKVTLQTFRGFGINE